MSQLITLREYATLHNISTATVRRRIKAGSVLAGITRVYGDHAEQS